MKMDAMARKAHREYTLAEVLADYPDEVCDLAMELRELVREVVPQARETLRWLGICYTRPEERGFVKGDVCRIVLQEGCVQLGFVHGAFLPDPHGLLEGDPGRKSMRYVRLVSARDIRRRPLRALLEASSRHRPGAG